MPLSAAIFRRGGQKKELFENIDDKDDALNEADELDEKLKELNELLHLDKSGRDFSAAIWRPALQAAEVVKQRKGCGRDIGFSRERRSYLHVEEAVFLVDRGDLLLFVEVAAEGVDDDDGDGGASHSRGGSKRQQQRLLSVQEAFDLMVSVGVPMERYLVYSMLCRSGYMVMRHPSRWQLDRGQQPREVWGQGAWARCYGAHPVVPGVQAPPPMQQQLAPGRGAATGVGGGAAAAAGSAAAGEPGANDACSPDTGMDVDIGTDIPGVSSAAQATDAAAGAPFLQPAANGDDGPMAMETADGATATASGQHGAHVDGAEGRGCGSHVSSSSNPASRLGVGPIRQHGSAAGQAHRQAKEPPRGPSASSRGWWTAGAADDPNPTRTAGTSGAPPDNASTTPDAGFRVEDRLGETLRGRFPRLQPFPSIQAAAPRCDLGQPGPAGHLVFDAYKPGAHVSRSKGVYPAVHCHLVLRSERPPELRDMVAADRVAAAAAAAEDGGSAPVIWAAVLNGDIALYSVGHADLLKLM